MNSPKFIKLISGSRGAGEIAAVFVGHPTHTTTASVMRAQSE